jgi:hypothetical protein
VSHRSLAALTWNVLWAVTILLVVLTIALTAYAVAGGGF